MTASAVAKPYLKVTAIDDAQHEDHVVFLDDVQHHSVVANSQPLEGITGATNRLDVATRPSRRQASQCEPDL